MASVTVTFTLLSLCFSYGLSMNICNICDCQPDGNRVFSITCDCKATQDLHLTSSMMTDLGSATMAIIKNCQTVSIEKNSFAQLEKLDTLGIQNCLHLYIATGAFSTLNSLLINNVQDVAFGGMAFMGARGIKNIIINSSNITEIPKFALYDVQGLDRLNLYNVNIGTITSNAINIKAGSVGIENIKIERVQRNGFAAEALKIFIKSSEFGNQDNAAFKLSTTFQTRFLNNHFKQNFLMEIDSPFVEFSGNVFNNLTSDAFRSITLPRLMNNTILGTDFTNIFQNFDHKDFHDNLFSCKCNQNLLNFTKHSFNYEILKKNYCKANCSMSMFDFEVESAAKCMKDKFVNVADLCATGIYPVTPSPVVEVNNVVLQSRFSHDYDDGNDYAQSKASTLQLYLLTLILTLLFVKI